MLDPLTELERRLLGSLPNYHEDEAWCIREEGASAEDPTGVAFARLNNTRSHTIEKWLTQLQGPNCKGLGADGGFLTGAELVAAADQLLQYGLVEHVLDAVIADVHHLESWRITKAGDQMLEAPSTPPEHPPGAVRMDLSPAIERVTGSAGGAAPGAVAMARSRIARRATDLALGALGLAVKRYPRFQLAALLVFLRFTTETSGFAVKPKAGTLSWLVGLAETIYKKPTEAPYLALCTTKVEYNNTGTTIKEPGIGSTELEGYKRKQITFHEAVEAEEAEIYNTAEEIFSAITGSGNAKIIGWALCTKVTVGELIAFGECTSTELSKTQSPPTVAAKVLKILLK